MHLKFEMHYISCSQLMVRGSPGVHVLMLGGGSENVEQDEFIDLVNNGKMNNIFNDKKNCSKLSKMTSRENFKSHFDPILHNV